MISKEQHMNIIENQRKIYEQIKEKTNENHRKTNEKTKEGTMKNNGKKTILPAF